MNENPISRKIIGAALEVHRAVGPGLLESVYHECLRAEFRLNQVRFESEKRVPIIYKGNEVGNSLRMDFLIEDSVVLEIKSVATLLPVHKSQLLSYLRMTGYRLGLLINFNTPTLTMGIKRVVNNL